MKTTVLNERHQREKGGGTAILHVIMKVDHHMPVEAWRVATWITIVGDIIGKCGALAIHCSDSGCSGVLMCNFEFISVLVSV